MVKSIYSKVQISNVQNVCTNVQLFSFDCAEPRLLNVEHISRKNVVAECCWPIIVVAISDVKTRAVQCFGASIGKIPIV